MNNIRKGDEVIVLTGRDKKRRGTVLARVDADHVLVEGVNVVKKHMKANPMANNPAESSKDHADPHLERRAVQPGHRPWRSRWRPRSRRSQGPRVPFQWCRCRRQGVGATDMSRLQDFYKSKVAGDLQAKFGYKSVMEVPASPRSP